MNSTPGAAPTAHPDWIDQTTTWLNRSFFAMLIMSLCAMGYWLGQNTNSWWPWGSEPQLPNGGLVVDAKYLDFGEVWETDDFEWTIVIRNPTESDIFVNGFDVSCRCLSISPRTFAIGSGESKKVDLRIDLTGATQRTQSREKFSLILVPRFVGVDPSGQHCSEDCDSGFHDNKNAGTGWVLNGEVNTPIFYSLRNLDLGEIPAAELGSVRRVVPVGLSQHFVGIQVSCNEKAGTVRVVEKNSESSHGKFAIEFSLHPQLEPGEFSTQVLVVPLPGDPKKSVQKPIALNLYGIVVSEVVAKPDFIYFGIRQLGEACTASVRLEGAISKISEALVDRVDEGLKLVLSKAGDQESTEFIVKCECLSPGRKAGSIAFKVHTTLGTERVLKVPVAVYGVGTQ